MWSTDDPPEIIEGTEPICDIEAAFDIYIDDDEALELYDMNLEEAARKIHEMKGKKSQPSAGNQDPDGIAQGQQGDFST